MSGDSFFRTSPSPSPKFHLSPDQQIEIKKAARPVNFPKIQPVQMPNLLVRAITGKHAGDPQVGDIVAHIQNGTGFYWATSEMCALVDQAIAGAPRNEVDLSPESAPCDVGMVAYEGDFSGALHAIDLPGGQYEIPLRAIFWSIDRSRSLISVNVLSDIYDLLNVYMDDRFGDVPEPSPIPSVTVRDVANAMFLNEHREDGPLVIVGGFDMNYSGVATDSDDGTLVDDVALRLWTTWHLMAQPYTSDEESVLPDRETMSAAYRRNLPPPRVRILHMRRATTDGNDNVPTGDRQAVNWSSRWLVSGHWRNQSYGPRNSLRRRVYVDAFVKGPQSKPLVISPSVHVWSR